jgi:hypothetical protein
MNALGLVLCFALLLSPTLEYKVVKCPDIKCVLEIPSSWKSQVKETEGAVMLTLMSPKKEGDRFGERMIVSHLSGGFKSMEEEAKVTFDHYDGEKRALTPLTKTKVDKANALTFTVVDDVKKKN